MSYGAEKIVKASDLVPDNDDPICVVVGAIAKGSRSHDLMRPIWTFGLSDQPTAVAEFFSGAINTQYSIFFSSSSSKILFPNFTLKPRKFELISILLDF